MSKSLMKCKCECETKTACSERAVNAAERLLLQLADDGKSKQCSIRVWRV